MRYLLFTGKNTEEKHGWESYKQESDLISILVMEAKKYKHEWAQIVDTLTNEIALKAEKDEYNHWNWHPPNVTHHSYIDLSTPQDQANIDLYF